MSEIKRLDTKTRKLLTLSKMHHTKADVDRLYLPRNAGGRGLIQLEASYKITTIGLDTYLKNTDDALIELVQEHDGRKKLYSIQRQAEQFKQELDLTIPDKEADETITKYAKRTKQMARNKTQEKLTKQCEDKALQGRSPQRIKEAHVDHHRTNQWLKSSGLKAELEGFIIAAQDQSLATRSYHASIIKDGTSPLCRMCNKYDETIDHIVSGCPELAKTEYIHRHDKAATYIHWKVCHNYRYNIKTSEKWYDHEPETVTENEDVTILWDMPIHTDRKITANRPDIVIQDHKTKTCKFIDKAVPSDRNTSMKVTEKLSKYKDLEIETSRMWGMRTETIPVITGALGAIKKGLEMYLGRIPSQISISELQKITLLGTAHILRRVLSS